MIYTIALLASLLFPTHEAIANQLILTARDYDIPTPIFLSIAYCESKMNPKALNPKDTDGTPSIGLFQFKKGTFKAFGGKNINDWQEQAEIAAQMMADGGYGHWPVCSKQAFKKFGNLDMEGF